MNDHSPAAVPLSLAEIECGIKAALGYVKRGTREALEARREIGRLLDAARASDEIRRGGWLRWLKEKVSFRESAASEFLQLYHLWPQVEAVIAQGEADAAASGLVFELPATAVLLAHARSAAQREKTAACEERIPDVVRADGSDPSGFAAALDVGNAESRPARMRQPATSSARESRREEAADRVRLQQLVDSLQRANAELHAQADERDDQNLRLTRELDALRATTERGRSEAVRATQHAESERDAALQALRAAEAELATEREARLKAEAALRETVAEMHATERQSTTPVREPGSPEVVRGKNPSSIGKQKKGGQSGTDEEQKPVKWWVKGWERG